MEFVVNDQPPDGAIVVTPDDDVQAAIDAAPPGSVVWLGPGTYRAPLTLKSGVRLMGATGPVPSVDVGTLDEPDQRIPAPGYAIINGKRVEVLDETQSAPPQPEG